MWKLAPASGRKRQDWSQNETSTRPAPCQLGYGGADGIPRPVIPPNTRSHEVAYLAFYIRCRQDGCHAVSIPGPQALALNSFSGFTSSAIPSLLASFLVHVKHHPQL